MSKTLRALLVTSWDTACGIAAHSQSLITAVQGADPDILIIPSSDALDPDQCVLDGSWRDVQLVHLNHHDALHARWTPAHVKAFTLRGIPVLVTYHDTTANPAPDAKIRQLQAVASSMVVHEPVEGLPAIYWRQGVAPPAEQPRDWRPFTAYPQQPLLGTVGFNFPWKNYDRLCEVTREEGWALLICSNNATDADIVRWHQLNPHSLVRTTFMHEVAIVNELAGCDATAFMYECANTGTSGAIRLGIAARKPLFALQTCRQFRDLLDDPLGCHAIEWVADWDHLRREMQRVWAVGRFDPRMHALAEQDSWPKLGANYARLYRMLAGESRS